MSDGPAVIKPLELLDMLREYPFLEHFVLALYHEKDCMVTRVGASTAMCGVLARHLVCSDKCESGCRKAVTLALDRNRPVIFSCRAGLLNFAVPYRPRDDFRYCFVGGGVRSGDIDIFLAERLSRSDGTDGFALLERLGELPVASAQEVKSAAAEVRRLLGTLDDDGLQARLLENSIGRFGVIRGLLAQVDGCESVDELTVLLGETLGILFDVPRAAVGLGWEQGKDVQLTGLLGMTRRLGRLDRQRLRGLFAETGQEPVVVPERELGELFPAVVAERAFCLPISAGEEILGLLALFDADLGKRETLLMGMVTDRIAARLVQFRREESFQLESSLAGKFMEVLSTLSATENRRDLYLSILETAADLLQASSGSLMLIDESGRNLRIESVLGMNLQLARSMSVRVGRGIAGKVAESGEPLLVKDIEQDGRVRIPNRSRFRTKSFVSIPLRAKGVVIGVLNLSDKRNGGVFGEEDLSLLTTVARHACVVLERTECIEKAACLEGLTVTDPLTGLFNRRFLEQRLEEEISRSSRQQLGLTVLLADLDNFKVYNELCGHAAGDVVLKKTARLLKGSARQMDVVTRFGGERFCVILPATSRKESLCVAERIRREVERAGFTHEENLPLGRLTVSIGMATVPENGTDATALLGCAEVALQRAKLSGRNRVVHFSSPVTTDVKAVPRVSQPDATA